jgi:site-specific DNA-methyltransferase (adenine-specific)
VTFEVINGDCLVEMPRLIERGVTVDAVIADPPYGVAHDTNYTRFSGGQGYDHLRNEHEAINGDAIPFDPSPWLKFPRVVLFGANCYSDKLPCGTWFIWDKRTTAGSTILSDGEAAWYSRGHGVYIFEHCWSGFARASEVAEHYHPTQKPVALMRWIIRRLNLKPGSTIVDPYMGSGSTGVAAALEGHNFVGIEQKPDYCRIGEARIQRAQGIPATIPRLNVRHIDTPLLDAVQG